MRRIDVVVFNRSFPDSCSSEVVLSVPLKVTLVHSGYLKSTSVTRFEGATGCSVYMVDIRILGNRQEGVETRAAVKTTGGGVVHVSSWQKLHFCGFARCQSAKSQILHTPTGRGLVSTIS